jgi:hypothetical protein
MLADLAFLINRIAPELPMVVCAGQTSCTIVVWAGEMCFNSGLMLAIRR